MTIQCDGCLGDVDIEQAHFVKDYEQHVRYCAPCLTEYRSFVAAATAQEVVFQRQMDEWTLWARARVNLRLTPLDLARSRATIPQTEGLTLG